MNALLYQHSFYQSVLFGALSVALLKLMMRMRRTTMMLLLCCCCWWWCSSSSWGCLWMMQARRMVRSLGQQLEDHQLILLSRLGRVPAINSFHKELTARRLDSMLRSEARGDHGNSSKRYQSCQCICILNHPKPWGIQKETSNIRTLHLHRTAYSA